MKKPLLFLTAAALLCLMIFSCTKDEALTERNGTTGVDAMESKVAPPPDLIIETYFTDISAESNICGDAVLPTTHCDLGDANRTFNAFVIIRNIGVGGLAPGTIEILWKDSHGPSFVTTVPHGGLAPQSSLFATRSYYVGPCDCVQFPDLENCFIRTYSATVDPGNLIAESNEMNNDSDLFDTCDGCGPCELPIGQTL